MNEHEQRPIARISKSMAMMRVHDTMLENIHAGIEPVSHTGDFLDVMVFDAHGREIPWPEVSRIGDEENGRLMGRVVNHLNTFQAKVDDLNYLALIDWARNKAWRWDEPELDETILSAIASRRRRARKKGTENADRRS